jgi:6-pyruvoyltetrahydropterin/6-carboxytetrahydropterin synthase
MYEASVERSFTAGHAVSAGRGALEEPHEHVWRMTAVFRAESLDGATDMVIDFAEVDKALRAIADELQGKDLSALEAFSRHSPTAERLAEHLARELQKRLDKGNLLYCLSVTEAPNCKAAFYPRQRAQ